MLPTPAGSLKTRATPPQRALMADPGLTVASVHKVLSSCDGRQVEALLKRICFDMVGVTDSDSHYHWGVCTVKLRADKKGGPRLVRIKLEGKGEEDDDHPRQKTANAIKFAAVHVKEDNLGLFKKKIKDKDLRESRERSAEPKSCPVHLPKCEPSAGWVFLHPTSA